MTSPAISVLMTTYNREKYVGAAIESVLNSSFKDIELVIVDDRSTDKTVDIVREWQAKDDRVKLFINDQNLGDYPNRNQAAAHATGKYLKYVDADDLIYPWGLQILWDCMERFPDAGWGLCSLAQDKVRPFPFVLDTAEAYRYHYLGPGLFHKAPLSSIIKKDLFESVGGFEPYSHAGDYAMWHKLSLKSPALCMSHGIVWYREHDDQSSNSQHLHKQQYHDIKLIFLANPENKLDEKDFLNIQKRDRRNKIKTRILNQIQKFR